MFNNNYNLLVKLLHYSIIGNKIIPELLFDIENFLFKKKNKLIKVNHQIYVTGLARAGTTVLLNTIYDTKKFASFTYRDMPFIICPNIWNIVSKYLKSSKPIQRKHNDNMKISLDSPEQFEEIFWSLKTSEKYIFKDHLKYHEIDSYNLSLYETFVKNCLVKYKKSNYLCKNNNNLLRIKSLIKKFPKFLLSFRNPLDHSISLLKQNINFSNLQKKDNFTKKYMKYLVHHEFGLDHKPMVFDNLEKTNSDKNDINYWLDRWIDFYDFIKREKLKKSPNLLFIDYEELCKNSKFTLKRISDFIGEEIFNDINNKHFSFKNYKTIDFNFDKNKVEKSLEIYKYLKN